MEKSYRAEVVGVFGCPVDENPTVILEEAAFRAMGLNYRYINFEVKPENLEQAVRAITALGLKGMNFTIPHKRAVLPYLDEISKEAEIIGAVNTVVVKEGKLWGDNTDGKGFLQSLRDAKIPVEGSRAVLLGAGGAARAIAVELGLAGVSEITVVNRSADRGKELAALVREKTPAKSHFSVWQGDYSVPPQTDIVVNATSIGLYPDKALPPVDFSSVTPSMTVCDVIPNPPRTRFLQEAAKRGAGTLDGLGMLVNQGAINFELWTGQQAPLNRMMEAIQAEFQAG